ncbi:MerR family transcriptional regulator [Aciduricibacillus chroicocephali]|uniref:MerR family transcriptional regulator n=1 Tax=Aciduricibacillus chroicocephali TaxID=3054939 RepID=A0ABY9KVY3_9BACI|nr:MerR family transcriptional regulator [Bacillaceae bacterium 44XB]
MYIKEAAEQAGVSIRTLHHYDQIGLLSPRTEEQGYRVYSDEDLIQLQQILFFRELGFKLSRIKEMLNDPQFDRDAALQLQRQALIEKKERLDRIIQTIEKTIKTEREGGTMTNEERFAGFDFSSNPFESEAIERWGKEAVTKMKKNTEDLPVNKRFELEKNLNELFSKLARCMSKGPASDEAQTSVAEWYRYLNVIGDYSPRAFKGLGAIYVEDERFLRNMEQYGQGFAQFMCEAMEIYADGLLN